MGVCGGKTKDTKETKETEESKLQRMLENLNQESKKNDLEMNELKILIDKLVAQGDMDEAQVQDKKLTRLQEIKQTLAIQRRILEGQLMQYTIAKRQGDIVDTQKNVQEQTLINQVKVERQAVGVLVNQKEIERYNQMAKLDQQNLLKVVEQESQNNNQSYLNSMMTKNQANSQFVPLPNPQQQQQLGFQQPQYQYQQAQSQYYSQPQQVQQMVN